MVIPQCPMSANMALLSPAWDAELHFQGSHSGAVTHIYLVKAQSEGCSQAADQADIYDLYLGYCLWNTQSECSLGEVLPNYVHSLTLELWCLCVSWAICPFSHDNTYHAQRGIWHIVGSWIGKTFLSNQLWLPWNLGNLSVNPSY